MNLLRKTLASICLAATAPLVLSASSRTKHDEESYTVTELPPLAGTISRGNSINDNGWIAGYSFTASNAQRRAVVWKGYGDPIDLGSLAGENGFSSVVWPLRNNHGLIAGISQTSIPDPNHENWSCSPFLYGTAENPTGMTCVGFVWQNGRMRALPTLGGYNGFAAGVNDRGQVTGWTETSFRDPTCDPASGQVLQFLPVIWGPGRNDITRLPLIVGDSSGSATGINDRGQAIGISGRCDQAVGRYSAIHAVLWDRGRVIDIVGSNGGPYWNTPMAINDAGEVVGFVGTDGDIDANLLRAFYWSRRTGFKYLQPLPGDPFSEALGINNRGQVVGISCAIGGAPCRAVLWKRGSTEAVTVNSLAPGYAGTLTTAQDINDEGEITGRANTTAGGRVAYRAVPTCDDDDE